MLYPFKVAKAKKKLKVFALNYSTYYHIISKPTNGTRFLFVLTYFSSESFTHLICLMVCLKSSQTGFLVKQCAFNSSHYHNMFNSVYV